MDDLIDDGLSNLSVGYVRSPDSLVEVLECLMEAALTLQSVTDIVEQLGIALIHFQARHEDGVL